MRKEQILACFVLSLMLSFFLASSAVSAALFSIKIDGNDLYSLYEDGTIEIWDSSILALKDELKTGVPLFSFDADAGTMYLGGTRGNLVSMDKDGNVLKEVNLTRSFISALAFDKEHSRIYAAPYDDKAIVVLDAGSLSTEMILKENASVNSFALDAGNLYAGMSDGSVGVRDRTTMELVKTIRVLDDPDAVKNGNYQVAKVLALGDMLYVGYKNGRIGIWELHNFSKVREFQAHEIEVRDIRTDGTRIFTSGSYRENSVKIWTTEGEPAGTITVMKGSPTTVAVDNESIYVGIYEGGILVYDSSFPGLAKELGEFSGPPPPAPPEKGEAANQAQNPVYMLLALFAVFFVVAVSANILIVTKKREKDITFAGVKKTALSIASEEDLAKLILISCAMIFVLGALNVHSVFPRFIPGLKPVYYFDLLVRKGALMPIWFIAPPAASLMLTKRYGKMQRLAVAIAVLLVAAAIFFMVPEAF